MIRIKLNTLFKTIIFILSICILAACENKQKIEISIMDINNNEVNNFDDFEIRVNGITSSYSVLGNNDLLLSDRYNIGDALSIELTNPRLNYYRYKFINVNKHNNHVDFKLETKSISNKILYALINGPKEVRFSDQSLINYVIHNKGNTNLIINNIKLEGNDSSQFRVIFNNNLPFSIPSNDSLEIKVSFSPTQNGIQNARMVIESNDYSNSNFGVDLYGQGTIGKAIMVLSKNGRTIKSRSIDFGRVNVESWKDIPLKLDNKGNLPLHASISLNSPDRIFVMADQLAANEINLPPGDSTILNIRFSPLQSKSYEQVLYIESNDKNERLILKGTGIPAVHEKLETIIERGKNYLNEKNFLNANVEFTAVLNRDQTRADAYFFRGISYYKLGEYAKARNDFDKVYVYRNHIYSNRVATICQSLFYAAYCATQYFYNNRNPRLKKDAIGRWHDFLEYEGCSFHLREAKEWLNKLTNSN